ncbi:MAG: hypothetical protein GXO82_04545, partial [Chlorobi bacterium]|nr:hypothetical protein [Chlorobiota bacterium]
GIRGVKSGEKFELLPAFVGSQSSRLRDAGDRNSGLSPFSLRSMRGELSLGFRYTLTNSIFSEATLNPDFSQVESDATQIDVNTTFALFYPERRPFFQEGSNLYDTWISAVYTRTINDPLAAAKLIGNAGANSFIYIGAWDEHSPVLLPFEERSAVVQDAGRSVSNIFRSRYDFGESSFVGLLVTDRRLTDGGSGSTFGADAMLLFLENFRVKVQVMGSHTTEPNDSSLTASLGDMKFDGGAHTAAFDGESYYGLSYILGLERQSRTWNFDVTYRESSPTFRAANGFVTQNNRRSLGMSQNLTLYPEDSFFDVIRPGINVGRVWNFDGVRKDEWFVPNLNLNLKGQTYVGGGYIFSNELFRNVQLRGIRRGWIYINSNYLEWFRFGLNYTAGRFVARSLETPVLGDGKNFSFWTEIKPSTQIIVSASVSYSDLYYPDSGDEIFSGYIFRSRINYQFTRELFLRLVVQYNQFGRGLDVEPLLTYKLNPFSIFYIGVTSRYGDFGSFYKSSLRESPIILTQRQRQYFLKFQYLFQV